MKEETPSAVPRSPRSVTAHSEPCQPVNKFPDFVRYIVQRLQALCPRLGKAKIAQVLARAGLHLAITTVGRVRR